MPFHLSEVLFFLKYRRHHKKVAGHVFMKYFMHHMAAPSRSPFESHVYPEVSRSFRVEMQHSGRTCSSVFRVETSSGTRSMSLQHSPNSPVSDHAGCTCDNTARYGTYISRGANMGWNEETYWTTGSTKTNFETLMEAI